MESNADALAAKRDEHRLPASKGGLSLADVGFADLGLDGGFEGCGLGQFGTWFDDEGRPLFNRQFSDVASMNAKAPHLSHPHYYK